MSLDLSACSNDNLLFQSLLIYIYQEEDPEPDGETKLERI